MNIKFARYGIIITGLVSLSIVALSRPVRLLSYSQLTKESQIIVIGRPTSSVIDQKTVPLPGNISPPVDVYAVNTEFKILALLKGNYSADHLVLSHFQLYDKTTPLTNGPGLVSFEGKNKATYLLFLTKREDGRFEATTGQLDPVNSVKEIQSASGESDYIPVSDM